MKKCPNCGSEVAEAAKFCTNCGSKLATGDEVKPKVVASEVQSENASEQAKESTAVKRQLMKSQIVMTMSMSQFMKQATLFPLCPVE